MKPDMRRARAGIFLAMLFVSSGVGAQAQRAPVDEGRDFGVAPSTELRLGTHAAPTPISLPGARTIATAELRAQLEKPAAERPLLFDVLGGSGHDSIPGSVWLADAGRGSSFDDDIQQQLGRALKLLSAGDTGRAMVFFCANTNCWLSYNAALRAIRLGYSGVAWYRGGIEAWLAAGGELAPMRVGWRRPVLQ
jgi:PQQ-dependent catabolism-associated CXXCW motif protein